MDPEDFIKTDLIAEMLNENVFGVDKKLKLIELSRLGDDGTFMLTICHRAHLLLEDVQGLISEYRIVIKLTPQINEDSYKSFLYDELFENEIRAYTEILPIYGSGMESVKYIYSYRKPFKACLVLADFQEYGWKMSKAMYGLSLQHILLAVKQLGRFHAGGYFLKISNRGGFDEIVCKLKESRFANDSETDIVWDAICKAGPKRAAKSIRDTDETSKTISKEFLQKLENFLENPYVLNKRLTRPIEPLATICHGDYLRNNFAFQYDTVGIPQKFMMFDYQTLRYASPMVDLDLIMSTACDSKTRKLYFDRIFDAYFNEMIEELATRIDIPAFMTRDVFLKEYIRYLPYGFAISTSFFPMLVEPDDFNVEDILDAERDVEKEVNNFNKKGGEIVNEHFRSLVIDMYELGKKYNVDIFHQS